MAVPDKNEQGTYNTAALSPKQFKQIFDVIGKEQKQARGKAKRTLTPAVLSKKKPTPQDLVKLGRKPDGSNFTMADLARFYTEAKKFRGANKGRKGVTFKQLVADSRNIDVRRANNAVSDGRGITTASLSSLVKGNIVEVNVKASSVSKHENHRVRLRLEDWDDQMMDAGGGKPGYIKAVKNACAGHISIDCSCGRHQYWYRYMSTVGGYQITPPKELAFPKVRNPNLGGLACKHVLKAAQMLQSQSWQRQLANHMQKQAEKSGFTDSRTHHFTEKERKEANKARKGAINQEKLAKQYQAYVKRTKALQKKIDSEAAKEVRKELLRAKKAEGAAKKAEQAALRERQRLLRDQMKLNLRAVLDAATIMGNTRDQALAAFAKSKNLPMATVKKLAGELK